jgi:predicted NBD/HSP70 family sugar kinase
MREVNSAAVLSALRSRGQTTVSELATLVGLSRQAVTRSLATLGESALVGYEAPEPTGPNLGRPAQLVRFRAEAGHVLGIDIDPHRFRAALADLAGNVSSTHEVPLSNASDKLTLVRGLDALMETLSIPMDEVWAASVAIPGVVDTATGSIKLIPSIPALQGDWLATHLREHLRCPVFVDNDIKIATEGVQASLGQVAGSFVFVHWGERVGGGIVIDGRLYRGTSNDSGDFGFLPMMTGARERGLPDSTDGDGPERFEEWVGTEEVVRLTIHVAHEEGDGHLLAAATGVAGNPIDVVLDAIMAGNRAASRAFAEIARRFTLGLVAIRAVLDPEAILIGGPMARLGHALTDPIRAILDRETLNQPWVDVWPKTDDAVLTGAIWHSLEDLFGTPERLGLMLSRAIVADATGDMPMKR